ncbi:tautomerase [Mycobacterium sp. Root265]|uniref:tautomerase family protein n=1 Tax=Mycobacterium sp. Root265 TaxID=1736504 RepID=UPI00070FABC0|nr:tautomerase family protein [Mycobacterium sp. Root265]KRD14404.1 tautomerase [Mycobacterium sp. Root265]
MPLVHLHVIENRRTAEQLAHLADVVQDVMLEHFEAPNRDRYQLITEHRRGQILVEDTGLGYERTDDVLIIQIFQQGRSLRHKQAAYRALADELELRAGLSPSDLIVSMVEYTRADWSFGGGEAQFVEGRL